MVLWWSMIANRFHRFSPSIFTKHKTVELGSIMTINERRSDETSRATSPSGVGYTSHFLLQNGSILRPSLSASCNTSFGGTGYPSSSASFGTSWRSRTKSGNRRRGGNVEIWLLESNLHKQVGG